MAPSPAVVKVFGVTELIEKIFCSLRIQDLANCRNVNHRFNDIITHTTCRALKQKLFLESITEEDAITIGGRDTPPSFFQNIQATHGQLLSYYPRYKFSKCEKDKCGGGMRCEEHERMCHWLGVNPLLVYKGFTTVERTHPDMVRIQMEDIDRLESTLSSTSLWNHTLLFQPNLPMTDLPAAKIELDMMWKGCSGNYWTGCDDFKYMNDDISKRTLGELIAAVRTAQARGRAMFDRGLIPVGKEYSMKPEITVELGFRNW